MIELPEPAGVIVVGTQAMRAYTASQMREHEARVMEEVLLAYSGALKACGVSEADRDAIGQVVRSLIEGDGSLRDKQL